jgi:hypothetical protein
MRLITTEAQRHGVKILRNPRFSLCLCVSVVNYFA